MLLTRFIKRQLAVFAVIAAVSLGLIVFTYGNVPAMFGLGVYDVQVHFKDASGLYPQANVTYRGTLVGKVTALTITNGQADATLRIDDSYKIPTAVSAQLHSTSAVGEQYVDLVPTTSRGPYLEAGSVIPATQSVDMPQIGPVVDSLNRLLESVPRKKTTDVLEQVNQGLGGAGQDVGGVIDASSHLVRNAQAQIRATTGLIDSLRPVLATQQALGGSTLGYANALAGFTGQLARHDSDLTDLLTAGGPALEQAQGLVGDVKTTLPMLLTNLTTNAQVLHTYQPNLQQILVVYPATIARLQSTVNPRAQFGDVRLDLRSQFNNPPSCTTGYVPISARRSPSDSAVRATNGTAHCSVAPADPRSVRGDRNLPCPDSTGRAALPAGCGLIFGTGTWSGASSRSSTNTAAVLTGMSADGTRYQLSEPTTASGGDTWQSLILQPLGLG